MTDRKVRVVKGFSGHKENTLCFQTGAPIEIAVDFDHHVFETAGPFGPTAVKLLHERILLGDSFPAELILNSSEGLSRAMAVALFAEPDLVLIPKCTDLVNAIDLTERLGLPGWAHIDLELAEVLKGAEQFVLDSPESESADRALQKLAAASNVLSAYLRSGVVPPAPQQKTQYEILEDLGPIVVFRAEVPDFSRAYRDGYIAGIWVQEDPRKAVIFRKSDLISYVDLQVLGFRLNREEFGLGDTGESGWVTLPPSHNLLLYPTRHPVEGTELEGTDLDLDRIVELVLETLGDE